LARLSAASTIDVSTFSARLGEAVAACDSLEAAAQTTANRLFDVYTDSLVLVRVYATVPYGALASDSRAFIEKRHGSTSLDADTPVLHLLGTRGELPEWNDRRLSQGHMAIPLVSAAFVQSMPMVAGLLTDLGINLSWFDLHRKNFIGTMTGGTNLFFVPEAASTHDAQGRHVISDQDFVTKHGVQTVFGVGGRHWGNTMIAVLFFTRERLYKPTAYNFSSVVQQFIKHTTSCLKDGHIFTELPVHGHDPSDRPA
jgi:hypothetical protein